MSYEKFKLKCGHEGDIIWRCGKIMGVRGTNRSCHICGKKGKGDWGPTVYIIDLSDQTQKSSRSPNGIYRL